MVTNEERIQGLIEEGHSAAWEQDWERAVTLYKKALELDQQNAGAWSSLGLAYIELGRFKEAYEAYFRAAKIKPDDPIPVEKLAQLANELGQAQQAAGFALRAGELYLKNREVQKAVENWAYAVRCTPEDQQAHMYLAKLYEKSGQREQAVREFMILASLQQHAGDENKAKLTLQHALEFYPHKKEIEEALGMLNEGRLLPHPTLEPPPTLSKLAGEKSSKLEKGGTELDPISEAHQLALGQLAGVFFDTEEEPSAETLEKKGLSGWFGGAKGLFTRQSDFGKIFQHLGAYLEKIKQEETEGLTQELALAIEAGLNHPAAQFELGYLMAMGDKDERAIKSLQQSAKAESFRIASYLLMGYLYSYHKRGREAVQAYLSALRAADTSTHHGSKAKELDQLYEPLIDAIIEQKDEATYQKVIEGVRDILLRKDWRSQLEKTRQQIPVESVGGKPVPVGEVFTQSGGYKMIGALADIQSLAQQGYIRSAMEEAYYALQHMPTYLPLHLYMGELLLKQGQMEEAFSKFLTVANTYEMRGDAQQAIRLYRRLIEISPMNTVPRNNLIRLLYENEAIEECLQEHLQLAEVYYNLADLKQARETYRNALELVKKSNADKHWEVMILHLMADIDLQNLDWRKALDLYEKIRKLDPTDEKARVQLVELNLRTQQEPQAVVELDDYIELLKRQGKVNKAREFLEKLSAEYGDWPVIKRRLESITPGARHTR
ncbi:MAG: tetratricopeptide repeat protein [Chloroflexota bacterium]